MVVEVKSVNEFDALLAGDKPVLVDFYATWCGPCKQVAPVVEKAAATHDDVEVVKLDVDVLPDVAARYKIMSIPTLMLFKNSSESWKHVGTIRSSDLDEALNKN